MPEKEEKEKKGNSEVITAIYKVNLHCQECGRKIKRNLLVTQGVQNVEIDIEKGEIKAKGKLDPLKILKLIEKKSKKKVELISPKIKVKDPAPPEKKPKETKEPIIRTLKLKVHMHCDKCERDLRNRLLKHKGVFSVKTDQKALTLTVEGTIEPDKLLSFIKRRVHKNAEIISSIEEKKAEEKEKGKKEGKSSEPTKERNEGKSGESTKEKDKASESAKEKGDSKSGKSTKEKDKASESAKEKGDSKSGESTKEKEEGKSGGSTKEKGDGKSGESTKEKGDGKSGGPTKEKGDGKSGGTTEIIEIQSDTKVEIQVKDNVPYIIHYVYAPQLFSDENPNACSIL